MGTVLHGIVHDTATCPTGYDLHRSSVPLPRVGPGVVEDVLALTVRLGIGGRDRGGAAVSAVDDDRDRLPSASPSDAARFLQRREEGVAEEGVCGAGAGVPVGGGHRSDAIGDARVREAYLGEEAR